MPEYLFAYGTLQSGLAPASVRDVADRLSPIAAGCTVGVLYDLGHYPGARFDAAGIVHGTVFRLPAGDEPAIWAALDHYEGVPDLFVRVTVPVTLTDGRPLACWAYQYNRDPTGRRPIRSGRYARDART